MTLILRALEHLFLSDEIRQMTAVRVLFVMNKVRKIRDDGGSMAVIPF